MDVTTPSMEGEENGLKGLLVPGRFKLHKFWGFHFKSGTYGVSRAVVRVFGFVCLCMFVS